MRKILNQLDNLITTETLKLLIIFCFVGLIFSGIFNLILSYYFDFEAESIKNWIQEYKSYAPFIYILLVILAVVISPIPSTPLGIAAGLSFGTFLGTVYSLIGAQIGAAIAFLIAKKWGRPAIEKFTSKKNIDQIDKFSKDFGFSAIIAVRFIPTFSFDLISYCAGLTSMNFIKFNLATFIGMVIPITGLVFVGDVLLTNPWLAFIVFGILVIAFIIPIIIILLSRRKSL